MPEGAGFSSRGGLTRAQPGPGCDVARRVEVGVDLAVHGADHSLLPRPGALPAASVAFDTRSGGIHEHHLPAAFLGAGLVCAEFERAPHRARSFRHRRSFRAPLYRHTASADTAPAVTATYDRDHKAGRRDRGCGKAGPQPPRGEAVELAGDPGGRTRRMSFHEQVHLTGHDRQRHHRPAVLAGLRADQLFTPARDSASHNRAAPPWAHHVIPETTDATCGNPHMPGHAGDYTHGLCQTTRFTCRLKTALLSRGA